MAAGIQQIRGGGVQVDQAPGPPQEVEMGENHVSELSSSVDFEGEEGEGGSDIDEVREEIYGDV